MEDNDRAIGEVEGTGAAINVSIGFMPRMVEVVNIDGASAPALKWIKGMAAGTGLKTKKSAVDEGGVAVYSVGNELIATGGIGQYAGTQAGDSAGFTIGADADINAAAETIVYVAFR